MNQRSVGNVAILEPEQYLTGGIETDDLSTAIDVLIEQDNKCLLVNLIRTLHLNNVALGLLIRTHSNYVRRGGEMVLCSVDKRIENIFVITKLSLVFNVYPDEKTALASFRRP